MNLQVKNKFLCIAGIAIIAFKLISLFLGKADLADTAYFLIGALLIWFSFKDLKKNK